MNKIILLLGIAFCSSCFGQDKHKFVIREFVNNDSMLSLDKSQFKIDKTKIFEDSLFIVSKTCSGEWGGTIKFKDKKTGIEYTAASTCPVVVNKLNSIYYVTNTLAHLIGFSEILAIADPKALTVVTPRKPRKKGGKIIVQYVGNDESKSLRGTQKLIDSAGVLTIASFPFQGHLYHIITNYDKTYLTKIVNNKYEIVDTISDQRLWTYNPEVFVTSDKHYIVFFENNNAKGYFDIYDNNITIVRKS